MKKLERIPLDNLRSLRAVKVLCKELKEVDFLRLSEVRMMDAAERILQDWPKVIIFKKNFKQF